MAEWLRARIVGLDSQIHELEQAPGLSRGLGFRGLGFRV